MAMPPAFGHDLDLGGPSVYNINQPSMCVEHLEVLLLVVIRTVFAHLDRRTVVRDTWAARKNYHGSFVHVLFFFSMVDNKHIQESIERENALYSDIVQYMHPHSDHSNLTLKMTVAAEWVGQFCPRARFVLVADDNVVVDVYKILPFLREHIPVPGSASNSVTLCYYRTSDSEMLLAKDSLMEEDQNFCSNEAFVVTPSVLDQLYLTIKLKGIDTSLKHLWLSNVADAARIKYTNTSQHFAGARVKPSVLKTFMSMDYMSSSVMVGIVSEVFQNKEATIMRHVWRIIQEHHTKMQISNVYKAQFPTNKSHDLGGVKFMALVLMCVDIVVVIVIFALIFCKKRHKKWLWW